MTDNPELKITSVTVRRLKTGAGYNNVSHEATAAVEHGQDPEVIRFKLDCQVQAWNELKSTNDLRLEHAGLDYAVTNLKREKARLELDVEELRRKAQSMRKTPLEQLLNDTKDETPF